MNTKLQIVLFAVLALIILLETGWMIKTEKRLKRIFLGKKGKDLEESIEDMQRKISVLEEAKKNLEKETGTINAKLKKSIRGLETVRFTPFRGEGGNQSFAIGMLEEEGDGVVISSLYSRERMSVFAKPVKKGRAEYELTAEEKEALEKAKV